MDYEHENDTKTLKKVSQSTPLTLKTKRDVIRPSVKSTEDNVLEYTL